MEEITLSSDLQLKPGKSVCSSKSATSCSSNNSVHSLHNNNNSTLTNHTESTLCNESTHNNHSLLMKQHEMNSINCSHCKRKLSEPKLLNCLHVFCKPCLSSMLDPTFHIECPKSKQATLVECVDFLEDDYVMCNMLDMLAIEEKQLDCSSCKTEEKAMARCADCAHFLCKSCVSAHQYMRCFEHHKVIQFDDIKRMYERNMSKLSEEMHSAKIQMNDGRENGSSPLSSCGGSSSASSVVSSSSLSKGGQQQHQQQGHEAFVDEMMLINEKMKKSKGGGGRVQIDRGVPIHKPLFCKVHKKESLKFFCNTCQIPICSECGLSSGHKQHAYERISDCESKQIEELDILVKKAKENVSQCHCEFQALDQYLVDLQEQLEMSKGSIEETFHSYQVLLEKRKDEMLKELDEKHAEREIGIMNLHTMIDMSLVQLNDVIKFSERILVNGNSSEILLLKKLIVDQIRGVITNMPRTDNVDISLKFVSDQGRFERAIKETFGRFYTQKEIKQNYLNNLTNNNSSYNLQQQQQQQQQQIQLQQKSALTQQHLIQQIQQLQKIMDFHQLKPELLTDQDWHLLASLNTHKFDLPQCISQLKLQLEAENNATNLYKSLNPSQVLSPPPSHHHMAQFNINNSGDDWCNMIGEKMSQIMFSPSSQQQQQQHNRQLNSMANIVVPPPQFEDHMQQHGFAKQQNILTPRSDVSNATAAAALMMNKSGHMSEAIINSLELDFFNHHNQVPSVNTNPSASQFANAHMPNKFAQQQQQQQLLLSNNNPKQNMTELTATNPPPTSNEFLPFPTNDSLSQQPSPSQHSVGTIGSGLALASFAGNGNLNPPVRQNGKMTNMQIRAKFGQLGAGKAQFNSPHGFCLGNDEEIIIADTNNHRIQVFDKDGQFKHCFGSPGREEGQLWYPRKVAVMRDGSGKYVVCDRGNERSRMQIFNKNGSFVKKISIRYIDIVAGLVVTPSGEIVAVDSVSPTVFRISQEGELVKWFDCSDHMREPSDIAVYGSEYYVCDFKGHCVVVFDQEGAFLRRIGGENITNFPNGIDVSDAGDVLIGDSHGNRFHVAVFSREGAMLSEFECPYVKVSRCCGLKITSEGYVVTLAKNNHHVLVLNTLYVA